MHVSFFKFSKRGTATRNWPFSRLDSGERPAFGIRRGKDVFCGQWACVQNTLPLLLHQWTEVCVLGGANVVIGSFVRVASAVVVGGAAHAAGARPQANVNSAALFKLLLLLYAYFSFCLCFTTFIEYIEKYRK